MLFRSSVADDATNEVGYSSTASSRTSYAGDGSYTIYKSSAFTAGKGPGTVTVRYGLASATASVTFNTAATANTVATAGVTATGKVSATDAATLPLTTKSLTSSVPSLDREISLRLKLQ